MLKLFQLMTTVSVIVALLPEIAFSRPLLVKLDYPIVPKSDTDMLVCYMHTEDGRTLDLGRLCQKKTEDSGNRSGRVNAEPCYFLDDDGRPCITTASNGQNTQPRNSVQRNKATTP